MQWHHAHMKIQLTVCLACMLAAAPAWAETRDRSLKEMESSIIQKANRLDRNNDGILSEDEIRSGLDKLGPLSGAVRRRVDANGDGVITKQEYIDAQIGEIRAADRNKDGILSVEEQRQQKRRLIGELLGR